MEKHKITHSKIENLKHVSFVHKAIKRVSEHQPVKCIECNKMFSKKANLKAHTLSVHKGIKRIRNKREKVHEESNVYLNLKIETVNS